MKAVLDKVALAYSLDVNPDDLDEYGNIKDYVPPVFEPFVEEAGTPECIDIQSLLDGGPGPSTSALDAGVLAGWCPGGSWSGGVCKPFNNNRTHWMSTYGVVSNLPIHMAILPGTHNSGFDKQAAQAPSMEVCQDVSPHQQLNAGIRVLDIRVQYYFGYLPGDPRRFQIFHSTSNGRTIQGDIINATKLFHYGQGWDRRREIVILNFHRFRNFTNEAHAELSSALKSSFGDAIISPVYRDLTVSQIWGLPGYKNVVVSYNSGPRDALFWPGVNQRWIGSNTPSDSELGAFIARVGNETKPWGELRAIQAHRMAPIIYIPSDISGSLMSWFAAGSANYPIMKHYIINCDWSLRHRLVDNIIYSNQFRSRALGIPDVVRVNPADIGVQGMPSARHMILRLEDSDRAESVTLPPILDEEPHRLLICSDSSTDCELDLNGCDFPMERVMLSKGDCVALVCLDGTRQWKLQVRDCSPDDQGFHIPAPSNGEKFVRYSLSSGNYAPLVYLPATATNRSVVMVVSDAPHATRIAHLQPSDQAEHVISPGQTFAFTYNASGQQWELEVVVPGVTID